MNDLQVRPLGLAVLALAASLALAGCSLVPGPPATRQSSADDGVTATAEPDDGGTDSSPGDIDLGQLQGVPETFPADIPLIEGEAPIGIDLGTGWSVVILAPDAAAAFAQASSDLQAAGFTVLHENTSDAGSIGIYESETYQIQLTGTDSPDYGPSLSYVVIIKG